MNTLLQKKAALTVNLLLDAASELVQSVDISELSFKQVAERADISQRTMFRHFTTREAFLDALTRRLYSDLNLPDIPDRVDALNDYISELYAKLDAQPRTVTVLLSSDLLPRVLATTAKQRLAALNALLGATFPAVDPDDVLKTAANLRYVMSASSWRYYRMYFGFDRKMATECAQLMVAQSVRYLAEKDNSNQ